jgi:hypothetical protein
MKSSWPTYAICGRSRTVIARATRWMSRSWPALRGSIRNRPIAHRTVAQQEALTLIRARNLIVRLRTAAVNAVRGLDKPCGYRLPASSTLCFAQRCVTVLPPGLARALGPVLHQIADMTEVFTNYSFTRPKNRLTGRLLRTSRKSSFEQVRLVRSEVTENAVFRQLTTVRAGAADPSFRSKVWAPAGWEFRPGKNYSICGENSARRRVGITPIVRCPASIGSMSMPWGNLRGYLWFGRTLARCLEARDRRREYADAEV